MVTLVGHLGGEGKSFLLAPLRKVFGLAHVQATPEPGSFPLLGLERKSVALLDEWTFDAQVLPLTTQLLWFEGKPFPVNRPQNRAEYSGHLLYHGTAPIFVTCKEKDFKPISAQADADRRRGAASESTMLLRRLRTYWLRKPLQVARFPGHVPECAACFARMVLHHARE